MKSNLISIIACIVFVLGAYAQVPDVNLIKLEHKNACSKVKDQQYSSTCWSFASVSFIESEIFRLQKKWVDLSEMYLARYSYINKANAFLQAGGDLYFTPGGQFHDVATVISENGIVPEEVYHGDPNNENYYNHEFFDSTMSRYVKSLLNQHKTKLGENDLVAVNRLLDAKLGIVPKDFLNDGQKYSPDTYASNYLQFKKEDYLEITSYTHHPFYTSFILEDKYNWMKAPYYNVTLEDFTSITDYALQNGFTVCWDGDVTESSFMYDSVLAYIEPGFKDDQSTRQKMFEDETTTIDHMMHIVGYGFDANKNKWYWVKNSWGSTNQAGGYLYMSEAYFRLKTVAIVVHKDAIPLKVRNKMHN